MPIFEYRCLACQQEFEHLQLPSLPDSSTPKCPRCQSVELERRHSTFAVDSDGMRQSHLQQARRLNEPIARDKKLAEAEVIRRIEADHHH